MNRSLGHRRAWCATASTALCILLACAPASIAAAHAPDAEEAALGSLVDAELAFARMGAERGVREAFLANFADDGIAFEPAPVRLRETWQARPAPADPLALKLAWKPAQAGISRSLDMGYTTGPFTLSLSTSAQPAPRHGVFFTVWQRAPGRPWKVLLDAGITTPAAIDFAQLGAAPRPRFAGHASPSRERIRLIDAESRAIGSDEGITPKDYARRLADDVRLHRDGAPPIASRAFVASAIARAMSHTSWTPADARVSAAGDMAFTYGRYRQTDHDQGVVDGYYAHLWLRDAAGAWQLAYDIALPATPP
jgi:ketosteroid isomerase-like protein